MKTTGILLGIATLLSSAVWIGGFITIDRTKYNNDFVRVFPSNAITKISATDLSSSDHTKGYTGFQYISKTEFVAVAIDQQQRKNVFIKSDHPDQSKDILTKQVDGILCTDGFLMYSKEYHRLIYLYRYRNQFLSIDTSLNVLMAGKTIDTTSVAKISVAEVNGELKMSKPPFIVNRSACVDGKYLFVNSNLVAKNESVEKSKDNTVIDVYNILDGSYSFSFYIENEKEERVQSFRVHWNTLIANFSKHSVIYSIRKEYLSR